ncbi:YecR family lipoprotein [Paracoccus aerodenitrificans]|uniref:YecR family lipoprotein n=1 Tax=Paracoccus aerodenitrificans TaxID=3017781 RepID=UPI0022F03678|nr:YecR family lipoprotein [Paracoccus aerodenitrificans]WBU65355.1 YecR family lipoprotein [Paracoccus aerodenitrificans]
MKKLLLCAPLLFAAGCSVEPPPAMSPDSQVNTFVEMAYEADALKAALIDWGAVKKNAISQCSSWGYASAQAYEGTRTQCQSMGASSNCDLTTVSRIYLCTPH